HPRYNRARTRDRDCRAPSPRLSARTEGPWPADHRTDKSERLPDRPANRDPLASPFRSNIGRCPSARPPSAHLVPANGSSIDRIETWRCRTGLARALGHRVARGLAPVLREDRDCCGRSPMPCAPKDLPRGIRPEAPAFGPGQPTRLPTIYPAPTPANRVAKRSRKVLEYGCRARVEASTVHRGPTETFLLAFVVFPQVDQIPTDQNAALHLLLSTNEPNMPERIVAKIYRTFDLPRGNAGEVLPSPVRQGRVGGQRD